MLTKKEFLKLCETSDKAYGLAVRWGLQPRGLDREVRLSGCWNNGTIVDVLLYKPNKQFIEADVYVSANKKCEAVAAKYSRWLEEYLASQGKE